MNSFFPTQSHISRRSLGAVGLSVAASLGLPGALAHAETADPATTGVSSRLVLPPEGGFRLDSAEFSRLYGPGVFTMSTLYNTHVGVHNKADRIVSIRFRSVITGLLQKIRLYWQAGSGYSSGSASPCCPMTAPRSTCPSCMALRWPAPTSPRAWLQSHRSR